MMQSLSVRLVAAFALCATVGLSGCAAKTRYGDARGVETVTNQFGSTDLQIIAESMTRSMLNAPHSRAGHLQVRQVCQRTGKLHAR